MDDEYLHLKMRRKGTSFLLILAGIDHESARNLGSAFYSISVQSLTKVLLLAFVISTPSRDGQFTQLLYWALAVPYQTAVHQGIRLDQNKRNPKFFSRSIYKS